MHPRDRMEKGIALSAIADTAKKMEDSGASGLDVSNFIAGAREKLTSERPDPEKYAKAAITANKWATANK